MTLPTGFDLDEFVTRTLAEDLGEGGDVTSAATIPEHARFTAEMNCREPIVVAGIAIAEAFFRRLDPAVGLETPVSDGERVEAGTVLMRLTGMARAMLTAERSALNTLQHLSGIATLTRRYVDAIAGTGATLLDTRKTIPGLRSLDKYAARLGGAQNHRMRLDDGLLIKDNHVGVAGGVAEAVRRGEEREQRAPGAGRGRPHRPDRACARGRGRAAAARQHAAASCARRSRWSPAAFRSKPRAGSISTPSAPLPKRGVGLYLGRPHHAERARGRHRPRLSRCLSPGATTFASLSNAPTIGRSFSSRRDDRVQGAEAHPLWRPRSLAAGRRRQGRFGDQPCSSGAWAAAGGIGTVSAVNADSYDPEGRIIPQVYRALTRRERHEELDPIRHRRRRRAGRARL